MLGSVRYFQFKYHSPDAGAESSAGQGPAKADEPEKLRASNEAALKASPRPEDFVRLMLSLRNADTNNQLAKPLMLCS